MIELPNYYTVLGVHPSASQAEVRAAYRRLARRHHPDVNPPDEDDALANERMSRINEAYEVLNDPARRTDYDLRQRQKTHRSTGRGSTFYDSSAFQDPPAHTVFYGWSMPGWVERFIAVEDYLRARIGPFLVALSALTPVLVLCGVILLLFWVYMLLRANATSWAMFSEFVDLIGGVESIAILGTLFLMALAVMLGWWRSYPRR